MQALARHSSRRRTVAVSWIGQLTTSAARSSVPTSTLAEYVALIEEGRGEGSLGQVLPAASESAFSRSPSFVCNTKKDFPSGGPHIPLLPAAPAYLV